MTDLPRQSWIQVGDGVSNGYQYGRLGLPFVIGPEPNPIQYKSMDTLVIVLPGLRVSVFSITFMAVPEAYSSLCHFRD